MAFDFGFILGADDSQFNAALARAESSGAQFASRVGAILKAKTKGFADLASGIARSVAIAGAIPAAFFAAAKALDAVRQAHLKVTLQALDHAEAVAGIRDRVHALSLAVQQAGGAAGDPIGERFEAVRRQIDEATRALERQRRTLESGIQARTGVLTGIAADIGEFGILGTIVENMAGDGERFARSVVEAQEAARGLAQLNELRGTLQLLEEVERGRQVSRFVAESEIELLRLSGRELDANILKEGEAHEARRRRLTEIAGDNEALFRRLEELENRRTSKAIENLQKEAAERERLEREREQREKQRLEDLALENDLFEERFEAERRRLSGDEKGADALERELEHRRRIRDIERREGLDDARRKRLIELENRNFALRGAAATRPEAPRFLTVEGGFAFAARERAQGLGLQAADERRRVAANVEKTTRAIEEIRRMLADPAERTIHLELAN